MPIVNFTEPAEFDLILIDNLTHLYFVQKPKIAKAFLSWIMESMVLSYEGTIKTEFASDISEVEPENIIDVEEVQ